MLKNLRLFLFACFLGCFWPVSSYAQVTVAPFTNSRVSFTTGGSPNVVASGYCLFAFQAGTTTPLATYSDLGVTLNTSPIILDSTGSATIYLQLAAYKFQLKSPGGVNCATGSQIWVQDNVNPSTPLSSFVGLTITGAVSVNSPTAATSGANQSGPNTCFDGNYWTGSVSAVDSWCWNDSLGTGANPTSTLILSHSGSSGTQSVTLPATTLASATITGALTAQSVDSVPVVGTASGQYATIPAAIAALPAAGGQIFVTQGTYNLSSAISLTADGVDIECANNGFSSITGNTGTIIKLNSGVADYAFKGPANPNKVRKLVMRNCVVDVSGDSSALGCFDFLSVNWSQFYNLTCVLPQLGAMTGFKWDNTNAVGAFWNQCFGCNVYALQGAANTHTAFYWTNNANSNDCFGCTAQNVGIAYHIDNGTTKTTISGGGTDAFYTSCIQIDGSSLPIDNTFDARCEITLGAPLSAAIVLGANAADNKITAMVVGAASAGQVLSDSSGAKNEIRVTDSAGQLQTDEFSNRFTTVQFGINKQGGITGQDIHGAVKVDGAGNGFGFYETANGAFELDANSNGGTHFGLIVCDTGDLCTLDIIGAGGWYITNASRATKFLGVPLGGAYVDSLIPLRLTEVAAPSCATGFDFVWGDSTAHQVKSCLNGGSAQEVPQVIASGTKALNTNSVTTATCDAGVAATATGVVATDNVIWSFNSAPTATNKYGAFLQVYAVPSANTVTFYTCNASATTSTPTAMTVNWSVTR